MERIAVALSLVLSSFSAWSYDGNDLYDWAKHYEAGKTNNLWYSFYTGYVCATAHYTNALGAVCPPSTTTRIGRSSISVTTLLKATPLSGLMTQAY